MIFVFVWIDNILKLLSHLLYVYVYYSCGIGTFIVLT